MIKKISALVLTGMLAMPVAAAAAPSAEELARKVDELTRQLQELQSQMAELQENSDEVAASVEERAEAWDTAARIQLWGDYRARLDYMSADSPEHYSAMTVAEGTSDILFARPIFDTNGGGLIANPGLNGGAGYTTTDPLGALLADPAFPVFLADQATFEGMLQSTYGATEEQAKGIYAMFTNPSVSPLLASFAASGATIDDFLDTISDTRSLVQGFMANLPAADRVAIFDAMGYQAAQAADYENDTMLTNRFRLNMRAKATENIDFKGRLSMYKAWGMQNNPVDPGVGGGPFMLSSLSFDGSRTRQPEDSTLVVDRAYANWNNIGGKPIWFSVGRRPTSGGPPSQLRQGEDERMATPTAYMDYPFDGLTLGYAYFDPFPGRIRFCYGRGFESGPERDTSGLNDVDFAGISWDVYNEGDRFLTVQSFGAFNMFNVPDNITFPNPIEFANYLAGRQDYNPLVSSQNNILDRANLGNIFHTTGAYMDKVDNLNYFLSLGWSRTDPSGYDELGTSLLTSWWEDLDDKDGFSVYAGIRYDLPDYRLKLGLEYNYGSEDWIAFTPGHDDIYASKLAVRGHAAEAYLIWDIPAGEAVSKYARAFMRLGYQHHWYNYTGSGFWLGTPIDVDELADDPLNAQFYTPVDELGMAYLTFDVNF